MKKLNTLLFTTIIFFSIGLFSFTPNQKERQWKYNVECASQGLEGFYNIKVYSHIAIKNKKNVLAIAETEAQKNAIHAVLFEGFKGKHGCEGQQPMCTEIDAQTKHADFFNDFFNDGGGYDRFASIQPGWQSDPMSTVEIKGKNGGWKISMVVVVSKDLLRTYLREKGIIGSTFGK